MTHLLESIHVTHPAYRTALHHLQQCSREHASRDLHQKALHNARVTRFIKNVSFLGITPSTSLSLIPFASVPLDLLSQLVLAKCSKFYIPIHRPRKTYPVYLSDNPYLYDDGKTDAEEADEVYDGLFVDAELYGWDDDL